MQLSFLMAGVWTYCWVVLSALAGTDFLGTILGDVHVFLFR